MTLLASPDSDLSEALESSVSALAETSEISQASTFLMEEKVAQLETSVISEDNQALLTVIQSLVVLMVSVASKDSTSQTLTFLVPLESTLKVAAMDSLQEDQEISAMVKTDMAPMMAHMELA